MLFALAAAVTAAGTILTASRTAASAVIAVGLRGAGAGRRLVALAGIGVAAWWILPRLDTRVSERPGA